MWGEILTPRKVDQKYPEFFETWSSRRMEKIKLTEYVRNEVLQRVKEERNFIFIVPCIVIFYGMTNRCDNVQ